MQKAAVASPLHKESSGFHFMKLENHSSDNFQFSVYPFASSFDLQVLNSFIAIIRDLGNLPHNVRK